MKNTCECGKKFGANDERHGVDLMGKKLVVCDSCFEMLEKLNGATVVMGNSDNVPPFFKDFIEGLMASALGEEQEEKDTDNKQKPKNNRNSILDKIGTNLTHKALTGEITPVFSRDKELQQVVEILNRKTKSNPVVLGEAGTGKTSLVEGLGYLIANDQVPERLKNKQLIQFSAADLNIGTAHPGAFEAKMKALIEEVQERGNVILFIDEFHQLVGTGVMPGLMDAGNILKPYLAKGEIQLIGATTFNEYRKFIERDGALKRRFHPVTLDEPNVEETKVILENVKEYYEKYHRVLFSSEVISSIVELSHRYIQGAHFPDKAIDVLDGLGAKLNISTPSFAEQKDALKKELGELILESNFEKSAMVRKQLKELEAEMETNTSVFGTADVEDVKLYIEVKTGIPVTSLEQEGKTKLRQLKETLSSRIIGQDEAVAKVVSSVKRQRLNFVPDRPASFMFVGPTGVGKTEMTNVLAEELLGTKDAIVRIDMSEYTEAHSISRLIGAPPGYVGYDQAGQLTEAVRRNPYSIILLDEIEKAHQKVWNSFLQVLDAGAMTDGQGKKVSFKDCIVIATSNAGVRKEAHVGFGAAETQKLITDLSNVFPPEFLNRFDHIVQFQPLEPEHMLQITENMLQLPIEKAAKHGVELHVTAPAKEKLAELGYEPAFGARPLRRVIQQEVEAQVVDILVESEETPEKITVSLSDGKITVK